MLFAAGDYRPGLFLTGAIAAEAMVASIAWFGVRRLPYQKVLTSVLLVIGFGWFLLRMKN